MVALRKEKSPMKNVARLALALGVSVSALACSLAASTAGPGGEHVAEGSVTAALTAIGPDSATYSVPTTDYLIIMSGGAQFACNSVTAAPTQTTSIPTGTYTFYLSSTGCGTAPPDAGTNVPFTLNRVASGATTTVGALLAKPAQTVTVGAGSSSSLVFQFTLAQLGTITMGTGNVTTSITADASVANAAPVAGSASATWTSTSFLVNSGSATGGAAAVAATEALFADAGAAGSFNLAISGIGAFAPAGADEVCAPFTPSFTTTANVSASEAALFAELSAPGATGDLCFFDPSSTQVPNGVQLIFQRQGAPVTTTYQTLLTSFGATATGLAFYGGMVGTVAGVYNGATLNLGAFGSPVSLGSPGGIEVSITDLPANAGPGAVVMNGVTATLSLVP
jgi:hypothetical protein